jgi:signal transduction histidine kinase/ActR/RegA family two-component response regulator
MMFAERWRRASRYFTPSPRQALAITVVLVASSIALFFYNDQLRQHENIQRAVVQSKILASTLAGAIAFDDAAAISEYLDALQTNPEVIVASVYDVHGELIAGFSRPGIALPSRNQVHPPRSVERDILVTAPVTQANTAIGSIYLDIAIEPLRQRVIHFLGIALVVVMACWLVLTLAAAHAQMVDAHRQLRHEMQERQAVEETLRHAQKMESLGELTGGVAHDFNNLLMAASSALELMERTTDAGKLAQLKTALRQTIDRGAALTRQLLAFARRTPLRPQVINLGDLLQAMRPLLERSLREDISVEIKSDAALWLVEIDQSQFELAIMNLAINARDAMATGGMISIALRNSPATAGDGRDMVRLEFRDNGTGIPAEVLPRVFEPFFTTKKVGRGTGLGLSQVYGYVHASGGELDISSSTQGTSIVMLLPRSLKAPTPIEVAETPAPVVTTPAEQRRILIVEDDLPIAELLTSMCAELGYQTAHAPNATAALNVLQENTAPIHMVLSDMVMPGTMDGLALALAIRKDYPQLPVLLTTGSSRAAIAAGKHGFRLLLKPYRLLTLAAELSTALSNSKQ